MINLTEDQKEILLDHMNKKLKNIDDKDCGFCIVAEEQEEKNKEINCKDLELYDFCYYCPLSLTRNDGVSCLKTRYDTLRDKENYPIGEYDEATQTSIENRIDYLIDMVNEHTDAKFGWLRNIKGEDRVIDYELKQKERKNGNGRTN